MAQTPSTPAPVAGEVFAAGDLEGYLRLLQITGRAELYPWSIRALSPAEVVRLQAEDEGHPWADRYGFAAIEDGELQIVAPRARAVFNSAFPFGEENTPMWAGRGLNGEISGGIATRYGPISLTLAPILYWAQNASFTLADHVLSGTLPFADPVRPTQIDLPQRFGDGSVLRLDPGQSTLRLEGYGVAGGISTANQAWGPAVDYPILLGANAPGFIHAFAGTSHPIDLWVGTLHGRLMWGRLEQSDYSSVPADSASRFTTGIIGVFTPHWVPGLEVGGARFFHMPWPETGFSRTQLLAPLETFVKSNLLDQNAEELEASVVSNQLVSVFGRWAFPRSGLEIYAELASEDHRHNLRDLILQLDHATAYTIGLQKAWEMEGDRWLTVRGELLNSAASHLHRNRRQEPFYVHASTRQGHTQLGQVLGSPAAYGGGGSIVTAELYQPEGRLALAWRRTLRKEKGEYLVAGVIDRPDVLHSLGAEGVLFRDRWAFIGGLTAAYNFNRDFEGDAFNLNAVLGVRVEGW